MSDVKLRFLAADFRPLTSTISQLETPNSKPEA